MRTSSDTAGLLYEPVHVVLADPSAYTPPYDHALAGALARAGARVELVTAPFRFGRTPKAEGYTVHETLYRVSSRVRRSRARIAVKALEHPLTLARLAYVRPDVLHLQWVPAPEVDAWLIRPRSPLVFTAHDLLPRRTAQRTRAWRRFFELTDRVVVHTQSGRRTLVAFGVEERKLHVIPHPVFRSDPVRRDDGRTVLMLGVLRTYKGLPDAVEAVRRIADARLLVAGDPRIPLDGLRAAIGPRGEWRLGYLPPTELERALSEATVAVFPYRPEVDQSGALLQALGAGVPAVVYDVGGLSEPVRAYGAGRSVRPGDVDGLTTALAELLDDPDALAAARAGAELARAELTWERAAAAHLELYAELVAA